MSEGHGTGTFADRRRQEEKLGRLEAPVRREPKAGHVIALDIFSVT